MMAEGEGTYNQRLVVLERLSGVDDRSPFKSILLVQSQVHGPFIYLCTCELSNYRPWHVPAAISEHDPL